MEANKKRITHRQKIQSVKGQYVHDLTNEVYTRSVMEQLSDDALCEEVIAQFYGRERVGSFRFCLIDEFIARFRKLRWPNEAPEVPHV